MPIPTYSDLWGGTLSHGVSIIQDGDVFAENEDDSEHELNIEKMNAEIAATTKDDLVFMHADTSPKNDLPFQYFLKSQKEQKK